MAHETEEERSSRVAIPATDNKTSGTIGAVIMLVTWMYVVSVVILVGGELNSELHHGTGSTASLKGSV